MAKVTYVLAQGENSAGESQVNFRVYVSRELRVRVPSGIWVDRKRWGKKNDINIPNIPGEERDALLAKRAKLKELVDVIETSVEAADDKSTVTREWLEKLIRRTLRPKTATSVEEKKIGFFARMKFKMLSGTKQKQFILDLMLHKKLPMNTITDVKAMLNTGNVDNSFVFDLINDENLTDEVVRKALAIVS